VILAHGLGGRTDLPLPTWMVSYGGGAVVVVSFAAVALLWRTPRWEARPIGVEVTDTTRGWARAASIFGRVVGMAALLLVAAAAIFGDEAPTANLAPTAVYIVLWVGVAFVCALVGDLWRVVNPFDTIAAGIERLRGQRRAGPDFGYWPAAVGLSAFVWLELVYPDPAEPRTLAVVIVAYTLLVVAAAAIFGREWLRRSEAFTALFAILAHAAPLGRDDHGRLRLRPPFAGLASLPPVPGLDAVVLVILGSTSFDRLTRTQFWTDLAADYDGAALTALGTVGLIWMIGVVAVIYLGAIRATARLTEVSAADTSRAFAPSLVPIVFAYTVAHYFSLLVLEGQAAVALISDPFGRGWDLFGTADNLINYTLLSPDAIAWVQAGAIVAGHVAAVVVAHDRASPASMPRLPCARSTRSSAPWSSSPSAGSSSCSRAEDQMPGRHLLWDRERLSGAGASADHNAAALYRRSHAERDEWRLVADDRYARQQLPALRIAT